MKTVQARQAREQLSSLLEAAERGEPTTIMKRGKPTAMLVSIADAKRIYRDKPSFIRHLMAFPGGIEFDRDQSPPRAVDL